MKKKWGNLWKTMRSVELNDIPISPLHHPSGIAKTWQLSGFEWGRRENMNEYESYCLCNSIKNNLRLESIVSVLSELAAPWENFSENAWLVGWLELCLEKEKAHFPGYYRDNSQPLARSLLLKAITWFVTNQSLVKNFKGSPGELANHRTLERSVCALITKAT